MADKFEIVKTFKSKIGDYQIVYSKDSYYHLIFDNVFGKCSLIILDENANEVCRTILPFNSRIVKYDIMGTILILKICSDAYNGTLAWVDLLEGNSGKITGPISIYTFDEENLYYCFVDHGIIYQREFWGDTTIEHHITLCEPPEEFMDEDEDHFIHLGTNLHVINDKIHLGYIYEGPDNVGFFRLYDKTGREVELPFNYFGSNNAYLWTGSNPTFFNDGTYYYTNVCRYDIAGNRTTDLEDIDMSKINTLADDVCKHDIATIRYVHRTSDEFFMWIMLSDSDFIDRTSVLIKKTSGDMLNWEVV